MERFVENIKPKFPEQKAFFTSMLKEHETETCRIRKEAMKIITSAASGSMVKNRPDTIEEWKKNTVETFHFIANTIKSGNEDDVFKRHIEHTITLAKSILDKHVVS